MWLWRVALYSVRATLGRLLSCLSAGLALLLLVMGLSLGKAFQPATGAGAQTAIRRLTGSRAPLKVIKPSPDEVADHEARLDTLTKTAENGAVWRR